MSEKYSESSAKFGKFVIRIFSKLQAPVFLMSKGKIWNKWPGGFPVMVVKTVGAKTKKVRNIPLIHVHKDGNPILVASLGGMPKNPSWYYNVKANPKVEVMTRNSHGTFIARQVSKEEKSTLWPIICETYPDYQTYQNNTDRDIPVFICDPV